MSAWLVFVALWSGWSLRGFYARRKADDEFRIRELTEDEAIRLGYVMGQKVRLPRSFVGRLRRRHVRLGAGSIPGSEASQYPSLPADGGGEDDPSPPGGS